MKRPTTAMMGALAVGLVLGSSGVAQVPEATVQMSPYGWRRLASGGSEHHVVFDIRRVVTGHDGTVFVGFLIPRGVKLRARGEPNYTFRIVELRAGVGKAECIWNVPTNDDRQDSIYLSANGSLIAFADARLSTLTGSHAGASFVAPDCYWIFQSASRGTLAVLSIPPRASALAGAAGLGLSVLDANSLELRDKCMRGRPDPDSISDSAALFTEEGPETTAARGQIVPVPENFCGPPDPVAPPDFHGTRAFMYYAVDNATVVGLGDHSFELWRFPNILLFSRRPQKHEAYEPYTIRIAPDGSRAGVLVIGGKGGSRFFQINPTPVSIRLDVFDLNERARIASIPLPFPKKNERRYDGDYPDFNFSPDGRQLAVLYQGVLRIYTLPSGPETAK